jgi:hypothetical protein
MTYDFILRSHAKYLLTGVNFVYHIYILEKDTYYAAVENVSPTSFKLYFLVKGGDCI